MKQPLYLPMTRGECDALGWDALDVLLVSGDAYVDHPSFAAALLGRFLVGAGFRVGVCAQPRWENREQAVEDIRRMGRPRLFVGVAAGAVDSMLAHYTAFRKKRSDDAYTPGGKAGARPNRACITYTGFVRQAFPGVPVVLGGIEASLRRATHYDFWADALRRSLLLDAKADLLCYGMGEYALLSIAEAAAGLIKAEGDTVDRAALVRACRNVPGLVYSVPASEKAALAGDTPPFGPEPLRLPSHEEIEGDPKLLMRATLDMEQQVHRGGPRAVQKSGDRLVVVNPPAPPLSEQEMNRIYDAPFSRLPHPSYSALIPAWEMIRTSITSHRGCGGGCSFCSLALHQGRRIASRGRESILAEAKAISGGNNAPRWAGSISDVGGPSANMWRAACSQPKDKECRRASCMHPSPCPFFTVDQMEGVSLLREIERLPGVRHVRVASGVRFDLALRDREALHAYTSEFTGGQLKVAPEHSEDAVLNLMRKPSLEVFERFLEEFGRAGRNAGKEQYTVPYLLSAFPGCTEAHMRALSSWLQKKRWSPQQIQCFIPTPGTVATAMFYTGTDPKGEPLYVARSDKERMRLHYMLSGGLTGERTGTAPRPQRKKGGPNAGAEPYPSKERRNRPNDSASGQRKPARQKNRK